MKSKLILMSALFSFILLTACQHTMEGFGKDMEHNGQKIQQESNK